MDKGADPGKNIPADVEHQDVELKIQETEIFNIFPQDLDATIERRNLQSRQLITGLTR